MANLTVQRKPVAPAAPLIEEVNIKLTLDEAQQLVAILGRGAGLIDGLFSRLNRAGVDKGRYDVDNRDFTIRIIKK